VPALALLAKFVVSRKAESLATGSHNDVAGFLLAMPTRRLPRAR